MGLHSTPGPSSHTHYAVLNSTYNEQDDSAPLPQSEYFSANIQSSGSRDIQNIGESSSHTYPPSVLHESQFPFIPNPVPSMPNHRPQLYSSSLPSSQGPSLTVPASPFPTDPSQPGISHSTSSQYGHSTGRRGPDRQMEQEETENHNTLSSQDLFLYGVPVFSAPPESSSTIIAGSSSSLPTASYTQPGVQDDSTSFFGGEVGSTLGDIVATQEQISTVHWQEASFSYERRVQRKKEMDKARKRLDRSNDDQDYARICELLNISVTPKKTRAHRILVGVEAMAETDDELRQQLREAEVDIRDLKAAMAEAAEVAMSRRCSHRCSYCAR